MLIILAVIVLLSFGQSTYFSLWQDDNALIFKLQHLEEQAGVFGAGPLGLGAYRYIAVPYIPLHKIFGLNIPIFYAWAIFFYFLATISIYLLAKKITGNNFLSFFSGAIFAAGFIGSDGILRLFNSIQTSYSIVLTAGIFFYLFRLYKSNSSVDYFLSVCLFYLSLETAFIRTQYLVVPVIFLILIFFVNWKKLGEIVRGLMLTLPFASVHMGFFLTSPDARSKAITSFINGLFSGHIEYTHGFFATLGNVVIPQPVTDILFSLAGYVSLDFGNRLLTLELIFLLIFLILSVFALKKIKLLIFISGISITWLLAQWIFFNDSDLLIRHSVEDNSLMLWANFTGGLFIIGSLTALQILFARNRQTFKFSLVFFVCMLSNILVYSIYLPFSPLESINRYLVHSLAGYALFLPLICFCLIGKKGFIILSTIIFLNIALSINYQSSFIKQKSIPTIQFYKNLKEFVPEIPKGSVLYFNVADNEISNQRFRDFFSVASMPNETAIAVRYGIDRYDFKMTNSFDEFISLLGEKPIGLALSFFYDLDGLKNTTDITRANLKDGGSINLADSDFSKREILTVTPIILEFSAKVLPKLFVNPSCGGPTSEERKLLLDYILAKDDFLRNALVKSSSQEKYQTTSFLLDGDIDTLWRGHRGFWHENEQEEILLDLGKVKNIGQLIWVNGYANSTPINYKIEVSSEGIIWDLIVQVTDGSKKSNGLKVVENFEPKPVRFIRMIVEDTFDNDSPAIGEIEAVETVYTSIDKHNLNLLESQSYCAKDKDELSVLADFIKKRGVKVNIVWETEQRGDNVVSFFANSDGLYYKYNLLLPAGGIKIKNLRIEPGLIPAEVSTAGIRVIYPNRDDLNRLKQER